LSNIDCCCWPWQWWQATISSWAEEQLQFWDQWLQMQRK
jgi:hypothetical protein